MNHPIIILIVLSLIKGTILYHCCKDYGVCSLFQPREPRLYVESNTVLLSKSINGCLCKEYSGNYAECSADTCERIPRNLSLTVSELRITSTHIKLIQKDDLGNYSNLTKLAIDNHNILKVIEDYAFHTLKDLTNISISFNPNLTFLNPKTFAGLSELRELYLVRNGFTNIADFSQALSPKYLPSLYELVLTGNLFLHVKSSDFEPMRNSPLRILNVEKCSLKNIDSDSLNVFTQLENLITGSNCPGIQTYINLISNLTEENNSLKNLNLYEIDLRNAELYELLKVISYSDIECLSLARNQFEFITKDTFPPMNNIKFLNLRDDLIRTITKDAFTHFTNLQSLVLSENAYRTIPQGAIIENLTYLDVSGFPAQNSYLTVNEYTFENMSELLILNLAYNKLEILYNSTFIGLSSLDSLSLKQCSVSSITPGSFLPLKKLRFLNLENNRFADSESRVLDTNLFEGLDNLNVLLLGGNKISYLSELTCSSLKSLTYLGLNDNRITHLEFNVFKSMNQLNTVDLERNFISSWHEQLFRNLQNLTNVYLGNNKITNFSAATLNDIAELDNIDLSNNNFICDCELYGEFKQWEDETHGSITSVLQNANASCFPTEITVEDYLLNPETSEGCKLDLTGIIIGVSIMSGIFALIGFFIYYYRWNLRYYLFLMKLYFQRKDNKSITRGKGDLTNYEFDAFVSYSNEDSNFIIRLISMLENSEPHLKLCVYERDFKIGSVISESIMESVIKSRKVLLVISNNYAKSQWCLWETHIAQHCNLFLKEDNGIFNDNALILLKLGKVSPRHLTPTLKYLLKTKIYLQWDENEDKQDMFWKKLKENIGKCQKEAVTVTRY